MAQQDGDDQRAARQAELDRLRDAREGDGDRSDDHTEGDAEENGHEVGLGKRLGLVADDLRHLVDALDRADDGDGVAHLQLQGRARHQFYAGARDARDRDAVGVADVQGAQLLAGQRGLGDAEAPDHKVLVLLQPVLEVHRHLFAEDDAHGVHVGLGGHDQDLVALLQDGVRAGAEDLAAAHQAGDEELVGVADHHLGELLAEDGRILHLAVHAAGGVLAVPVLLLQLGALLVQVDLEEALEEDEHGDDADHAERVGDRVGGGEGGSRLFGGRRRLPLGDQRVEHRVLGGTQSGRVGHGAGQHADHRGQALAGDPVDGQRHEHAEQDHSRCEQVEAHAALAERLEEAGTDLHADGEDEQDEPEFLHEGQRGRIGAEAEMAEQDPEEQDPGGADRDPLDLLLPEPEARGDDDGEKQDRMGDARAQEQLFHGAKIQKRRLGVQPSFPYR